MKHISQIWNASQIIYNVHTESDPNADGMITTWTDPAGNVKVMSEAGTTVTLKNTADGWQSAFGDEWYYLEGGKPATGWKQIGGTWYYFYEDGSMATGLVKEDNTTYTLGEDGTWTMAGWNEDAYGNWSYADGAVFANRWHRGATTRSHAEPMILPHRTQKARSDIRLKSDAAPGCLLVIVGIASGERKPKALMRF